MEVKNAVCDECEKNTSEKNTTIKKEKEKREDYEHNILMRRITATLEN